VVRVPETAYDVTQLLRVVYGFVKPGSVAPFAVLAAWLRVGIAYRMRDLFDAAEAQTQPLFPTDLDEWDERDTAEYKHNFHAHHAIEALNVFRRAPREDEDEFNMSHLIPAAVYRCCQLEGELSGLREDGSVEELSAEDVALVGRAQARLKAHGARMVKACKKWRWSEHCDFKWAFDGCYDVMLDIALGDGDGREALLGGDPLDRQFQEHIDEQKDEG
ncbi:hypothetical protein C8Q76DRAFT_584371, partial [Earliella scabrosa]